MVDSKSPVSGGPWHEDDAFWSAASASLFGDEARRTAASDSGRLAALRRE